MGDRRLVDAAVQRVDVGPLVAMLRLRAPGETSYLILAAGRRGGVGLLASRPWKGAGLPGGSSLDGEKLRVRARIEGARVEALGARWILLRKGEARFALEAGAGEGARVTLRELPAGEPLADDARAGDVEDVEDVEDVGAVGAVGDDGDDGARWAEGERIARALGEDALATRRLELGRAMAKARARIDRRVEAVRADLGRIDEADELAARATAFVAEASRAPRGATRLTVTDWSTGAPQPLALELDPARPAREQIDAMFKRSRRLKLGAVIARRRLDEASQAAARLDAVGARLGAASSLAEVEALAGEARAAAPRDFALAARSAGGPGKAATGGAKAAPSRPFRLYRDAAGERILVGRGAAHNDALTFHHARPHDLWLHAKGRTGAHVLVPLEKGHTCPADRLVDAAHLAAHFSEAREEAIVEVQHTERRYLRKPRGSAPGLVVVDREKVLVLRVERERLARLLAAEEP